MKFSLMKIDLMSRDLASCSGSMINRCFLSSNATVLVLRDTLQYDFERGDKFVDELSFHRRSSLSQPAHFLWPPRRLLVLDKQTCEFALIGRTTDIYVTVWHPNSWEATLSKSRISRLLAMPAKIGMAEAAVRHTIQFSRALHGVASTKPIVVSRAKSIRQMNWCSG